MAPREAARRRRPAGALVPVVTVLPKTLVAVTLYGHAKDYVLPKFGEMLDAVIEPTDSSIRFYGDRQPPSHDDWVQMPPAGAYAEDMLTASRERAFEDARAGGFDVLMLHGVDALWLDRAHFESIVRQAHQSQTVRAPLICARADANHAILRRFRMRPADERNVLYFGEEQDDVPTWEIESGLKVVAGFPGADNIAIPKRLFDVPFAAGHDPWYDRVAQGRPNLCVEENWCLRALNAGHLIRCDTSIRIAHVHEDGVARIWRGVEVPVDNITWDDLGHARW